MSLWIILEARRQLFQQESHAFQAPRWRGWLVWILGTLILAASLKLVLSRAMPFERAATSEGCFCSSPPCLARSVSSETRTLLKQDLLQWCGICTLPLSYLCGCLLFGFILSCLVFSCSWPMAFVGKDVKLCNPFLKLAFQFCNWVS